MQTEMDTCNQYHILTSLKFQSAIKLFFLTAAIKKHFVDILMLQLPEGSVCLAAWYALIILCS